MGIVPPTYGIRSGGLSRSEIKAIVDAAIEAAGTGSGLNTAGAQAIVAAMLKEGTAIDLSLNDEKTELTISVDTDSLTIPVREFAVSTAYIKDAIFKFEDEIYSVVPDAGIPASNTATVAALLTAGTIKKIVGGTTNAINPKVFSTDTAYAVGEWLMELKSEPGFDTYLLARVKSAIPDDNQHDLQRLIQLGRATPVGDGFLYQVLFANGRFTFRTQHGSLLVSLNDSLLRTRVPADREAFAAGEKFYDVDENKFYYVLRGINSNLTVSDLLAIPGDPYIKEIAPADAIIPDGSITNQKLSPELRVYVFLSDAVSFSQDRSQITLTNDEITELADDMRIRFFYTGADNTGAIHLQINALGLHPLLRPNVLTLKAGELPGNYWVEATYFSGRWFWTDTVTPEGRRIPPGGKKGQFVAKGDNDLNVWADLVSGFSQERLDLAATIETLRIEDTATPPSSTNHNALYSAFHRKIITIEGGNPADLEFVFAELPTTPTSFILVMDYDIPSAEQTRDFSFLGSSRLFDAYPANTVRKGDMWWVKWTTGQTRLQVHNISNNYHDLLIKEVRDANVPRTYNVKETTVVGGVRSFDIRPTDNHFRLWKSVTLGADNNAHYIPVDFGRGILTTTDRDVFADSHNPPRLGQGNATRADMFGTIARLNGNVLRLDNSTYQGDFVSLEGWA